MSAIRDCGPCMTGDHSRHTGAHEGLPGVLGGWHCKCHGDCAERMQKRDDAMVALLDSRTYVGRHRA